MPITAPGQVLPALPSMDPLNTQIYTNGMFGGVISTPPWSSGGSADTLGALETQLGCVKLLTTSTAASVTVSSSPFILQWFDFVSIEWYWYLPTFGNVDLAVVSAGLTSGGGTFCTSNVHTAQIGAAMGGTACTGAVLPGFWSVFTGKVSVNTRFNTTTQFFMNQWYKCRIDYNKNPKTLNYYVNDNEIVAEITNINFIPDTVPLTFRINSFGTVNNVSDFFYLDYVKISTESAGRDLPA